VQGVHCAESQRAVLLATGTQGQQHRLARRRGEEFLFAGEQHFHRALGGAGEVKADHLERVDVELGAEAAADRRLDDADARRVDVEVFGELALVQEGHLGVRVHLHVAGGIELGNHARDAHAAMGDVVQLERVLDHRVGFGLALNDVAVGIVEAHGDVVSLAAMGDRGALLEVQVRAVRAMGFGMDQDGIRLDRVFGIADHRQVLVLDLDQLQRGFGDFFRFGGHRRDLVALAAHAAHFQREVVLGDADRALVGDVGGGDHHMHAGQGFCRRGVDGLDQGMDACRPEDLAVQLAGQVDVVDVARAAAGLVGRIHFWDALADQRVGLDDAVFLFGDCHGFTPSFRRTPESSKVFEGMVSFLDPGLRRGDAVPAAAGNHGVDDFLVARAAAQVAFQAALDAGRVGMLVFRQQVVGLHHHARRAEAALHRAVFDEGFAQRFAARLVGEPLDGDDIAPGTIDGEHQAGVQRHAIDLDGAGAAFTFAAAVLGAGEADNFAQHVEGVHRDVHREFALDPIEGEFDIVFKR
jgi:hypothetical protein